MIDPSIGKLLKKSENLYTLCILTGKRARQLTDGAPKLIDLESYNEVTIAANEINDDKIIAIRNVR